MRLSDSIFVIFGIVGAAFCKAENTPARPEFVAVVQSGQAYYWKVEPVAGTAQLLTLFCHGCGPSSATVSEFPANYDVPLVAVLRDTLGDYEVGRDRLTDVWLLEYANPGIGKKLLSAVPFFYWHPGDGAKSASADSPKPLLDLTAPQHPVWSAVGGDLLQWTALDPMMMPVRASSRSYRANGVEDERLHLETAISDLRSAPVSDEGDGLTESERDTVIARLELRKRLLGGLVNQKRVAEIGKESGFEEERIRSRNWELLRQLAEKTGLIFEPLSLAGKQDEYAILWFPTDQAAPNSGTDLKPIWKILNIRDPWSDDRLKEHSRTQYVRDRSLIPLGLYSLTYPKLPLLMVDFRDQLHLRRHEMTQRAINEITAGVIGISHFTNWYYYVGADLYDFVSGRHGAAMDKAERLDAYSRLRMDLALDRTLDSGLRKAIQARLDVSVNPLEAAPAREMRNAQIRYSRLEEESGSEGRLAVLVDRQRRTEIATFGKSDRRLDMDVLLHFATFGLYNDRAPQLPGNASKLALYRRVDYELGFLDGLAGSGTAPEVSVDRARIQSSVKDLNSLLPAVDAPAVRKHAIATLEKLRSISQSPELQADCSIAIAGISQPAKFERKVPVRGVVAEAAISAQSSK